MFRQIPVPADLIARLLALAHAELTAPLWRISRGRAWQLVKELMLSAAIPPGPHQAPKALRHGFAIHALRSGVPLTLVQRWLGHGSLETTAIYLDVMGLEEREIAARMWEQTDQLDFHRTPLPKRE